MPLRVFGQCVLSWIEWIADLNYFKHIEKKVPAWCLVIYRVTHFTFMFCNHVCIMLPCGFFFFFCPICSFYLEIVLPRDNKRKLALWLNLTYLHHKCWCWLMCIVPKAITSYKFTEVWTSVVSRSFVFYLHLSDSKGNSDVLIMRCQNVVR